MTPIKKWVTGIIKNYFLFVFDCMIDFILRYSGKVPILLVNSDY